MSRTTINKVTCDQCGKEDNQDVGHFGTGYSPPDGWISVHQHRDMAAALATITNKEKAKTVRQVRGDFCSEDCLRSWAADPTGERMPA